VGEVLPPPPPLLLRSTSCQGGDPFGAAGGSDPFAGSSLPFAAAQEDPFAPSDGGDPFATSALDMDPFSTGALNHRPASGPHPTSLVLYGFVGPSAAFGAAEEGDPFSGLPCLQPEPSSGLVGCPTGDGDAGPKSNPCGRRQCRAPVGMSPVQPLERTPAPCLRCVHKREASGCG
jgi:hypothetical protein